MQLLTRMQPQLLTNADDASAAAATAAGTDAAAAVEANSYPRNRR